MDAKTNDGINYIIVDGGHHQLKYHGQLQGMKKPIITHIPSNANDRGNDSKKGSSSTGSAPWTICGSLCTSADVITTNYDLTNPEIGDYLLFHRTGAYSVTEGMALFLSRDLPSVYIITNQGELKTLRHRMETADYNTL